MRLGSAIWLAATLALAGTAGAAGADKGTPRRGQVRAIPVGRFEFETPEASEDASLAPEELSGITWIEGNRYLAIGDEHAVVHPLTIEVNDATGAVRSATFGAPLPLRDRLGSRIPEPAMAKDREGIAYDPARREIWVANEQTGIDPHSPSIERFSLEGSLRSVLRADSDSALAVFRDARPNRSLESMARALDGSGFWTVNEDALPMDGPAASDSAGASVRLTKLDPDGRLLAQYAYPLDPYRARIRNPSIVAGREISGVSEVAEAPGGRLLVLERAFGGDIGGNASLRSRLYLVDPTGATDVSGVAFRAGLAGRHYTPVRKTLLWQENWGFTNSNFEGMALGPELRDGSRLLVLIADNNGGSAQAIFTLRLR